MGDPEQLQPFSPQRSQTGVSSPLKSVKAVEISEVPSIFKVVSIERHYLELQYRIPRLIANILDKHIYHGKYKTHESVPFSPFPLLLIDVPWVDNEKTRGSDKMNDFAILLGRNGRGVRNGRGSGGRHGQGGRSAGGREGVSSDRSKYSNSAEAIEALEIFNSLRREDVLILTPYRDQLKELHYHNKTIYKINDPDKRIITFDQSQGIEADYIIISLTNSRPTKFLDFNRLNVTFSRAKKRVILLADFNIFGSFCNSNDGKDKKRLEFFKDIIKIGTKTFDAYTV